MDRGDRGFNEHGKSKALGPRPTEAAYAFGRNLNTGNELPEKIILPANRAQFSRLLEETSSQSPLRQLSSISSIKWYQVGSYIRKISSDSHSTSSCSRSGASTRSSISWRGRTLDGSITMSVKASPACSKRSSRVSLTGSLRINAISCRAVD